MFLKIAPFSQSYDFWIALFFCIIAAFIWLIPAYLASKSGSESLNKEGIWIKSDKNLPITSSGYWNMFLLHLVLGTIMFIIIGSDRWDLWFIN